VSGEIVINLGELERILEFAIVAVIAWLISISVRDLLHLSDFPSQIAILGQWAAFFLILLAYYWYIKPRFKIKFPSVRGAELSRFSTRLIKPFSLF
jgi:hypothetical protein